MAGLVAHPQLSDRDRWREVDTPAGKVRAILPPMGFADVELAMGAVPALGEHTADVLAEIRLSSATIEEMLRTGAAGAAPTAHPQHTPDTTHQSPASPDAYDRPAPCRS